MAVDLALAKQHLRVTNTAEDTLIAQYLAAAISWVENHTGKLLTRRAVAQDEVAFTAYLSLHFGPDPETITVDYTDTDDAPQTIADAKLVGGRLYPAIDWPRTADNTPVVVNYTAGYETTPADLDSAVLLLVGHFFANREAVVVGMGSATVEMAVEALCRPYRSLRL